ncbi:hypothetical protein [Chryseolinea lacunae]|uniref:Uncharacterized protein n=1 Tax=Chryseolinea lacunae TaxID=2801331 RepID=A0ABS1KVM0_9BACT|nr:hypothetical protein [Chryseolinea lacunae]MBL0743490.1 hypothetical protein [Chryseolinea lacunae]
MSTLVRFTLIIFLLSACRESNKDSERALDDLSSFAKHFCLLDHGVSGAHESRDQKSLVFSKMGRWERSYILVLREQDRGVRGVFQEVDLDKNASNDKPTVGYFRGSFFALEKEKWEELKVQAQEIVTNGAETEFNEGMLDQVEYILSYNGRTIRLGGEDARMKVEHFSKFLLDSVVDDHQSQYKQ